MEAMRKAADSADDIADTVHTLMHLYRTQQYRASRDGSGELTHMEGKVLGFFSRHPGASQSELVAHAARDKGQLARLIAGLRERGLLAAHNDDNDRRVVHLHLSAAGRALHTTVQRQRLRVARLAVADLSDKERQQLVELLRRVRGSLEAAKQERTQGRT